MSSAPKGPDSMQIDAESLATAPFPGRADGLRVYFEQKAYDAVSRHASEDTDVEICGVLVGTWKRDTDGPYAHISASIRGDAATSKFAEVTFTHETWAKINERMDKEFTDRVIVGWYHTHPDFGVFLSDRDVFIHEHFFSAPGQIAFVIDPIRREEGVFVWKKGKPVLTQTHWAGAGQRWAPRQPGDSGSDKKPADTGHIPITVTPAPQYGMSPLMMFGVGLCVLLIGFLLAKFAQRQEQVVIAQALAQQLYNHTSSVNAMQSARELRQLLSDITAESRRLTGKLKEGEQPPKAEDVVARVARLAQRGDSEVDRIISAITLRPEQTAALDALVEERVKQQLQDLLAKGVITLNDRKVPSSQKSPAAPQPNPPATQSAPANGG